MPRHRAAPRALALVLLLLSATACGNAEGEQPGRRGQGGGAGGGPGAPGAEERVPVEVAAVRREPMVSLYSTSSTLRSDRRATVTTRTAGVIRRLLVEEGDAVREGQSLAVLDDEEQSIAAERAQATLDIRQREYERLERLFAQELVSEEALETARREHRDAQHAAQLARVELSRTVIQAPFAGVVLDRHLDPGNTVTSGTPVYTLADVDPLYTDVDVPERHVARLSPGQQVRLTSDAARRPVAATIQRIAPQVDPGTGTVKVTLAVAAGQGLRPGTFVRVDIITDTREEALVVPRSALVAEGRRWYVYRLDREGTAAEKVEVTLGYEAPERVEVLPVGGSPLAPGTPVVVAGAGALSDGSPVEVMAERETAAEAIVEESR
ncbi:MAG TPA: efflux RND transporter periplasmic adaptor subunit [Thermoanaerobaculia bacterium]|nr:efflux RND transporter periplasmic adaptor subunit [Thermoanaerobaculia bacterium]